MAVKSKFQLKAGGFVRAGEMQMKNRLIMCSQALPKCGKTEFGFTMPGPLAIINLDEGLDGVLQKWQKKKEIYISDRRKSITLIKSINGTPGAVMEAAAEEWEIVKKDYIEALGEARSVFVDTGGEFYELLRLAKLGKLTQVMPHQYGPVNKEMKNMMDLAYDSDANVLFSHRMKREYVNDKATQNYARTGWGDIGYECQVVVQQWKDPKETFPDRYHVTLMDCRIPQGAELEGEDLQGEMASFPMLATMILGGDLEEWS